LASDRGLRELVLGSKYGPERVLRARGRIKPLAERLVLRAQEAGALRADMNATDIPLILFMIDAVVDATREADAQAWRRALAIVLDGLRADGATPLPSGPLDELQLDAAMRAWRP